MASAAITYKRLFDALRALHFKRDAKQSAKGHVTFVCPFSNVPIILPVVPPTLKLQPVHLAMVRRVLRESIPEAESQFNELLEPTKPETNGVHKPTSRKKSLK